MHHDQRRREWRHRWWKNLRSPAQRIAWRAGCRSFQDKRPWIEHLVCLDQRTGWPSGWSVRFNRFWQGSAPSVPHIKPDDHYKTYFTDITPYISTPTSEPGKNNQAAQPKFTPEKRPSRHADPCTSELPGAGKETEGYLGKLDISESTLTCSKTRNRKNKSAVTPGRDEHFILFCDAVFGQVSEFARLRNSNFTRWPEYRNTFR